MPFLVSRKDPTGICSASLSGTNLIPFWLADADARAAALGMPTRTFPATSSTFTVTPCCGSGRSSSLTGSVLGTPQSRAIPVSVPTGPAPVPSAFTM